MHCTAPLQHWQALQKSCIWRANGPKAKPSARAGRKGGAACQDAWAAGTGAMAAQTSPCLCRRPCCGSWHRACKSPGVTRKEKEFGLIVEVFCCHVHCSAQISVVSSPVGASPSSAPHTVLPKVHVCVLLRASVHARVALRGFLGSLEETPSCCLHPK